MSAQPDVLQSCFSEAARAARPALERCIDEAVAFLQDAELHSMKVAERDELAQAWRELQKQKSAWSVQYPADLLVIFKANTVAARQSADSSATSGAPLSSRAALAEANSRFANPENFSLVDDADVSQAIEAARLLQQVLPPVEQVLAELNSLVSTLQGLPNVRPELNPLRPDAFTQALRNMVSATAVNADMASTWLRQLALPLGRELKQLYETLVRQLEQANVQGASYRVLQTPASASRPRGGPPAAPGRHAGPGEPGGSGEAATSARQEEDAAGLMAASQYADLSNFEIRDELFQDFLFHGGGHAQHGLAPSYYDKVEQELASLQALPDSLFAPPRGPEALPSAYQNVPAVDRPQRAVGERSHLNEQVWGPYGRPRHRALVRSRLKKDAKRVGQVLGLEVVRKLVNQVARDKRLPVPVREAIVALEPALLRLAMLDPRFFSDEAHAGRRIMERVAQRSFKYNDEFGADFVAFFQPVAVAFNSLNHQEIADASPFAEALYGLETRWEAQDQQEAQQRNTVLTALRFAEERQNQADQIAFDLSARSDLDKVPGLVLDFLFGPWSLAMAHARLIDTRHQVDPMGFGSVVPDLLWSVKQEVTLKRPAKLIEMIPSLLGKLHAGLDLLGQAPRENERFFEGLMGLHRPVLRLRRLKSQQDAEESNSVPMELETNIDALPATPEQRRAKVADHPWMGRDDLDAAGFEDTLPSAPGSLHDDDHEGEDADAGQFDWDDVGSGAAALRHAGPETYTTFSTFSEPAALAAPKAAAAHDALHDAPPAPPVPEPALAPLTLSRFETEQVASNLRTGQWVDLFSKREWLRAQLIWASTKGTLFMFVSHGGQPHSMTKRSCERLIRERLLRPVDGQGVVAHALDGVVAEVSDVALPIRLSPGLRRAA